jgi:protein-S-isoprenylcysteine O-methyltransferase Ste14
VQAVLLGGVVSIWAVAHSWLATNRMKALAAARLGAGGARAYRLAYNIVSVATLGPIAVWMSGLPDRQVYAVPPQWAFVMVGIQLVAAAVGAVTLLRTNAVQFAGISQVLGRPESNRLETTGLYGLVRHPLYLFGLIILWLSPNMSLNQLTVSVVLSAYLFLGALFEERRLVAEFGKPYEAYRARTPMIIPGVGHRKSE